VGLDECRNVSLEIDAVMDAALDLLVGLRSEISVPLG
jgi:hypothetical protein